MVKKWREDNLVLSEQIKVNYTNITYFETLHLSFKENCSSLTGRCAPSLNNYFQ